VVAARRPAVDNRGKCGQRPAVAARAGHTGLVQIPACSCAPRAMCTPTPRCARPRWGMHRRPARLVPARLVPAHLVPAHLVPARTARPVRPHCPPARAHVSQPVHTLTAPCTPPDVCTGTPRCAGSAAVCTAVPRCARQCRGVHGSAAMCTAAPRCARQRRDVHGSAALCISAWARTATRPVATPSAHDPPGGTHRKHGLGKLRPCSAFPRTRAPACSTSTAS
jgi:hypothetical protein